MPKLTKKQDEAVKALRRAGYPLTATMASQNWSAGGEFYVNSRVDIPTALRKIVTSANPKQKKGIAK